MTVTTPSPPSPDAATIAPGSVVVVRDEEWLVRATEATADGLLVRVQGLGELVRDTEAVFYDSLDIITALDPAPSMGAAGIPAHQGVAGHSGVPPEGSILRLSRRTQKTPAP